MEVRDRQEWRRAAVTVRIELHSFLERAGSAPAITRPAIKGQRRAVQTSAPPVSSREARRRALFRPLSGYQPEKLMDASKDAPASAPLANTRAAT